MRKRLSITEEEKSQVLAAVQLLEKDNQSGVHIGEVFGLIYPDTPKTKGGRNTVDYSRFGSIIRSMADTKEIEIEMVFSREKGRATKMIKVRAQAQIPETSMAPVPAPSSRLAYVAPVPPDNGKRSPQTRQFECSSCPNSFILAPAKDKPYRKHCEECGGAYLIIGNLAYRLQNPIRVQLWELKATL